MFNNRVTFLSRFLLPPESARAVPGSVQVWALRGCKLELEWCDLFTMQRYDILQWRCPFPSVSVRFCHLNAEFVS